MTYLIDLHLMVYMSIILDHQVTSNCSGHQELSRGAADVLQLQELLLRAKQLQAVFPTPPSGCETCASRQCPQTWEERNSIFVENTENQKPDFFFQIQFPASFGTVASVKHGKATLGLADEIPPSVVAVMGPS